KLPHACDECKRRKMKCDALHPRCSTCSHYSRRCTYSAPPKRSPVTRKYISWLEAKLAAMRA
ncbi:lactose regulatory protein, partial [Saitoella complicata NRRL Y-17804]